MSHSYIASDIANAILSAIHSSTTPVMVFGSAARGDASDLSDIDVLELSRRSGRPFKVGRLHVYAYSEGRLHTMAKHGELFVLHLKLEGQIIRDSKGTLAACLDAYQEPTTYERYREALRSAANLLDADRITYVARWSEYNALALFVLRTVLYVQFAEAGDPLFSLNSIARRLNRHDVGMAVRLKNADAPDFGLFCMTAALVSEFLETTIHNPFGSVEALVTNKGIENPSLAALGLRLLGNQSPNMAYDSFTLATLS